MTHLKIIEEGEKSMKLKIPHKRCLQRLRIGDLGGGAYLERVSSDMERYIANYGPLSYKVEFAKPAPDPELEKKIIKLERQEEEEEAWREVMFGPIERFENAYEEELEEARAFNEWHLEMWWQRLSARIKEYEASEEVLDQLAQEGKLEYRYR
ncbi:hypothetical protein EAE96_003259 [Botrytis aclada]|nr:hypothetical protein EAE96_003259 [Botrytis aclada]